MADEKASPRHLNKDRTPPRDYRDDARENPPFLNDGPELVRDTNC